MDDQAPGVVSDPGRDVDQFAAHRRSAGFGVCATGKASCGAGQVVCHGGQALPCGVGGETPRRQMCQRSVDQIGENLLSEIHCPVVSPRTEPG